MSKINKIKKKDRPYSVVPYNPQWAERYEEEKKIIAGIFKENALRIEHIGSTSVEGMWAKPQIDVLVTVEDLQMVDKFIDQMESKGYVYQADFNKHNERYFTRDVSSGERLVSVHIMQKDNPKAPSLIYLREYLQQNPKDRDLYSRIKKEAYESGVDRAEYPERKKEVLDAMIKRAEEWHSKNED